MVCVLFLDKYLKNFITSALEILGFDFCTETGDDCTSVICCEETLDDAVSRFSDIPASVIILISKNKRAKKLCDAYSADIKFILYPFDIQILRTLLFEVKTQSTAASIGEVEFSAEENTVSYCGKKVKLTEREGLLFSYLYGRRGECTSREEISEEVWGRNDASTNVTDVYISYLRKKLTPILGSGVIRSVHGVGYILDI